MKTIKVSELTGAALDWAVTQVHLAYPDNVFTQSRNECNYSTDWAQGGPIIEREAITVSQGSPVLGLEWMACDAGSTHVQHGPTYLIAAMRCYVASNLGDEVNVPKELL